MTRRKTNDNPPKTSAFKKPSKRLAARPFLWFVVIGAVLVCAAGWLIRDLYLRSGSTFDCGDGPRRNIDFRDFVNRYSSWSVSVEAEAQGKGKIGGRLEPTQAQQLSEAVQQAAEFRKYVVAGY